MDWESGSAIKWNFYSIKLFRPISDYGKIYLKNCEKQSVLLVI